MTDDRQHSWTMLTQMMEAKEILKYMNVMSLYLIRCRGLEIGVING